MVKPVKFINTNCLQLLLSLVLLLLLNIKKCIQNFDENSNRKTVTSENKEKTQQNISTDLTEIHPEEGRSMKVVHDRVP
jgi:hypothetical protein